jgi:hypothetical protein
MGKGAQFENSRCVSDLEKKRTVTALTLVIARLDRAIQ